MGYRRYRRARPRLWENARPVSHPEAIAMKKSVNKKSRSRRRAARLKSLR